jgi:hypothetical protein
MIIGAKKDQQHAGNSKDDKEAIVLFKKTRFNLVMIAMQNPKKAMHNETMGEPGNTFHQNESSD